MNNQNKPLDVKSVTPPIAGSEMFVLFNLLEKLMSQSQYFRTIT
jgi:hypothetical protein